MEELIQAEPGVEVIPDFKKYDKTQDTTEEQHLLDTISRFSPKLIFSIS